jgi:hypothetical protein
MRRNNITVRKMHQSMRPTLEHGTWSTGDEHVFAQNSCLWKSFSYNLERYTQKHNLRREIIMRDLSLIVRIYMLNICWGDTHQETSEKCFTRWYGVAGGIRAGRQATTGARFIWNRCTMLDWCHLRREFDACRWQLRMRKNSHIGCTVCLWSLVSLRRTSSRRCTIVSSRCDSVPRWSLDSSC